VRNPSFIVLADCLIWTRKSQIAIEYAYRQREECPQKWIFWVHAGSAARFEKSYRDIAAAVKLSGLDDPKTDVLDRVFQWLKSDDSGKWLMILDNADDESIFFSHRRTEVHQRSDQSQPTTALSAYLPQNSRGSILVTSRNRVAAFKLVDREEHIVKVELMEQNVSKELLRRKLPNDESNEEECSELVKTLGCLPLAITQAAAFIAMMPPSMTISKYLEYFRDEKNQVSLLSKDGGDLRRDPEVPNAVVVTWQISFDQIKKESTQAAKLLSRMCVLDRQGIPKFLFCQDDDSGARAFKDDDGDALFFENGLAFDDAIGTLIAFSFIEAEKDRNIFQMHRLVQLSTKKWLEGHGEIEKRKVDALKLLSKKFPDGDYANWKICEALNPHTRTALAYTLHGCKLERAKLLHRSASYAVARGNYGIAEGMLEEAVYAREKLLGQEHLKTLASMNDLALTYLGQKRCEEAEKLQIQVLETRKRVFGQEHPDTLTSMNDLASTYWNQKRWEEAEELQMQVLETRKRVLGQEHPDTLTSMNNLASTYWNQKRWEEAEELEIQVLEARKRVLGQEHPNTLVSMHNLASTYWDQKRWEEAEELQMQVLETTKRVLGQEHPDTLTTMNHLASTYSDQKRWEEAEKLQIQVLETRKRVLEQEHPDTLTSMNNLASTYSDQKRWEEAEKLDIQVLETRKRVLGQEHPNTLVSMHNLACTWKSQGRDKEAVDLMKQAVRLHRDVLGSGDPDTIRCTKILDEWQNEQEAAENTSSRPASKRAREFRVRKSSTRTSQRVHSQHGMKTRLKGVFVGIY
jgi:tetratricopeptide (TPR) repeat protein